MRFLIRDDDLSFFTKPERLEKIYNGIWDKYPIYFSAIPKVYTRQQEIPKDVKPQKDYYVIDENKKLVEYLKNKIRGGKVTIWQHGFTHKDIIPGRKFELESTDFGRIYNDLRKGKEILEKTFNIRIDTLIAPHDRFSKQAILAVEKIGYKYICRGFTPLPREIRLYKSCILSYFKLFLFWLRYGRNFRYPEFLKLGKHKEFFSYRIENINNCNINQILKLGRGENKVLIVTLHHHKHSPDFNYDKIKFIIDKISKIDKLNK